MRVKSGESCRPRHIKPFRPADHILAPVLRCPPGNHPGRAAPWHGGGNAIAAKNATGGEWYGNGGDLTIRGMTRSVALDLHYLGRWKTPYNEARFQDDVDVAGEPAAILATLAEASSGDEYARMG
jgi:hypothetical protein